MALALSILILGLALTQLPGIRGALEASMTSEGTWVWRMASWAASLAPDQMRGLAWFLGKPFGTPATRFMLGQVVDVAFHSHYVSAVVQTGVLGLSAWLILWSLPLFRWRRQPCGVILAVTQLIFGIAYSVEGIQGLIIALSIFAVMDKT